MRWKKWRSVIGSVNRAQKDEMEKMEVRDSICEQGTDSDMVDCTEMQTKNFVNAVVE